ncbi:MAG TPA: DUF4845 domain-containing protein [Usitatibacter sp.]|nr:DUF4845 domain-containing protein [Usitatibacter sp.]
MHNQRGVSLTQLIVTLAVAGFLAVMGMKLIPSYIDYFKVKKIFATMDQSGDLKGSVSDIRRSFQRRNAIEDVRGITEDDLEIAKEGGGTVVSASWSVKVPLIGNAAACLDFYATTAADKPAADK